jgi:hypothetical protein
MLVDTVLYTRISRCGKSWSLPADGENWVENSREEGKGRWEACRDDPGLMVNDAHDAHSI